MTPEQLYAQAAKLLTIMENQGSDALNDEQHTLLAYCWLDNQVQEGGFVQLIASGWGGYIFDNPVADSLRRWKIKPTPKILDKARALYHKIGDAIETAADEDNDLNALRHRFPDFEELDADYYDCAEEDMAAVCAYVAEHQAQFGFND